MKLAAITFSPQGVLVCEQLKQSLDGLDLYLHEALPRLDETISFSKVMVLVPEIFTQYAGLIFVAPAGLVIRSIASSVQSKLSDPAVIVVDVGGRTAISLLSGHEGGANDLAVRVGNILDAEPMVSTTTEAVKDLIVGIGCRKGKTGNDILVAVNSVLDEKSLPLERVRYLATADVKAEEAGLCAAAKQLNIPLRIISSERIRDCQRNFQSSVFVEQQVNLPAVAEPAALLAGWRTSLIVQKQACQGITIAVAQENCLSLASVPETV
ncbi:MAG: cobalamin biosynthesis protein CbiG [Desulfobacteraceae bacterium 4572_35.1]|nr:MAG: cobalamin biosynthesis protein CbiG [Desulfobacteraceae bacterium 4572_35.1]